METTNAVIKASEPQREVAVYAQTSEIINRLSRTEQIIIKSGASQTVGAMQDTELTAALAKMLEFITMDIGLKKPSDYTEWQFCIVRFAEFLKRYNQDLTLDDVKTAFELLTVGELDEYLPKNSNGEPDRAHYQTFNFEYYAKVFKAYKKKRSWAIVKSRDVARETKAALRALPQTDTPAIDAATITRRVFDEYKATRRLAFGRLEDWRIYNFLIDKKQIMPSTPTDEDKERAFQQYMLEAEAGQRNRYEARFVKFHGKDATEVQPMARKIAQRRAIKEYFDKLIAKENGSVNQDNG